VCSSDLGLVSKDHPEVYWHLIGDGELRPDLEALAEREKLSDKVIFAGRLTDVTGYLGGLQIGVLCSDSEGFSNALLEYMFKGCAVVATDVGGNSEVIDSGENGLLVPPADVEALALGMRRLIEDVPLRQSLAHKARAAVVDQYSWRKCVDAHESYYHAALNAQDDRKE